MPPPAHCAALSWGGGESEREGKPYGSEPQPFPLVLALRLPHTPRQGFGTARGKWSQRYPSTSHMGSIQNGTPYGGAGQSRGHRRAARRPRNRRRAGPGTGEPRSVPQGSRPYGHEKHLRGVWEPRTQPTALPAEGERDHHRFVRPGAGGPRKGPRPLLTTPPPRGGRGRGTTRFSPRPRRRVPWFWFQL